MESQFEFYIYAPVLNANNLTIIDTSGNNNGLMDPGEEVTVRISLTIQVIVLLLMQLVL